MRQELVFRPKTMAPLKIVTTTSPEASILHEKTQLVEHFDEPLKNFAASMMKAMWEAKGIGIAAPQVGRSLALVVIDIRPCAEKNFFYTLDGQRANGKNICPLVMANPRIIKFSVETTVNDEGCLSVPGVKKNVRRFSEIDVDYCDINGNRHTISCGGIFAICMQHEIDHLNGILFTDRAVEIK
ncbi:MAG: peptide deformylase [Puniceicoccales bacterium]|jgi:peptide deformylase|nr:peptide deformylase [Puniceicoccales bacterium]